jgi:hypothetical protein
LALQPCSWADRITLKTGDVISGSVLKKDKDKLIIKSADLGEVTIPWASVATLATDGPITVELPGGELVTGTVMTRESTLEITAPNRTASVSLAEVGALRNETEQREYERRLHPDWFSLWTGAVDIGYALARGNARTDTFTAGMNASRITSNDKTTAYFRMIYASGRVEGVTSETANAARGGWAYNRNLTRRVFLNFGNDYEYDVFQDLDLRFVAGGGLGYILYESEAMRLDILGGANYQREKFSTGLLRNSAEIFFGDDWTWKVTGLTNLTQSYRFYANATRTGEYRMRFDLGAITEIRKWLGWTVTISDRFLSDPVPGRQRNDLLLATGLSLSFSR